MTEMRHDNEALVEIESKIRNFPALPSMCGSLLTMMNDSNVEFGAIAEEMRYDPGMTANVLKLANSAYFGARGEIDSLQTAIVRLGSAQLFQVVMSSGMAGVLKTELSGYGVSATDYLRHSIWVGVASEELANVLGIHKPDTLFTAGLLHDIGKLVLDGLVERESVAETGSLNLEAWELGGKQKIPFDELEKSVFGMDHAEAGACLLEKWNFPKELINALRWHHEPENADGSQQLVSMVHVADMLAYNQGIGSGVEELNYRVSADVVSGLGLRTRTLEYVACETLGKMEQLEKILSPGH